jgi:hypothetical protein
MPITQFLDGERLDEETRRALGLAFEMTCIALRVGDCADDVRQAVANKLIALAKAGERDPDRLCEEALKDIRTPQQCAASEAAHRVLHFAQSRERRGNLAEKCDLDHRRRSGWLLYKRGSAHRTG